MTTSSMRISPPSSSDPKQSDAVTLMQICGMLGGVVGSIAVMGFILASDVPDAPGLVLNDARFIAMNCGDTVGPYTIRRVEEWMGLDSVSVSINGMTVLANSIGGNRDNNRKGYWREEGPWQASLGPVLAKQREACAITSEANKVAAREANEANKAAARDLAIRYEQSAASGIK